jgi:hypothetical protein
MPKRITILIGLLAGAIAGGPAAAQDIYRWVDEDGVVHFSDTAPGPVSGGVSTVTVEDMRSSDYDPEADIYNVAAQAERMQALREKMAKDREDRRERQRSAAAAQPPVQASRSVGYGIPPWWWDRPGTGRPPKPERPEPPIPVPPPTSTLRPLGQDQN